MDDGENVRTQGRLNEEEKDGKKVVNSGSGDERVPESHTRIMEFAGVMVSVCFSISLCKILAAERLISQHV